MTVEQVYVVEGADIYHASADCDVLQRRAREGVAWCSARDAHFSRLRPCAECAQGLDAVLKRRHGSLASGEKAARGLPEFRTHRPATAVTDAEDADDVRVPYGPPEDLDDPRFRNTSAVGWGTATFGQDPEEFLGSSTDDDHDWRGAGRHDF
jgi:hypothetical protein